MSSQFKIIILRSNPVDPDPRVEKEATALCSMAEVVVLARDRNGRSRRNDRKAFGRVKRVFLPGSDNTLILAITLLAWWVYVFFYLLSNQFDIVHACDFDTYLPALFATKLKRRKIVYDICDFYADTFSQDTMIHKIVSHIDKKLIQFADLVILVDKVRLAQISPAKPKRLIYFYNVPHIDIGSASEFDPNYFFYAGMLSRERMIETLLEVFARHPSWRLTLAGWGPLEKEIKEHCLVYPNIHFMGRTSYETVITNEKQSLLILAFYDPAIPNHKYASPNKLFEAVKLGKPIISNTDIAMADFIENHQIGELIPYGNGHQLAERIALLQNDSTRYNSYCRNCIKLAEHEFSWQTMATELISGYRSLIV